MTRLKKMFIAALAAAGILMAGAALQPAQASDWACVGLQPVDLGVCVGNPVPSSPPALPPRPGPHPLLPD